ncbi:hypothetical protein HPB47_016395 [Ixodes persulcatus]|uniref:Uncharacterized protein n=1 Tax=Ixodes persulcatus TaxID=34615 RepID=A0AC60QR23_IXOPE|nr:hypothetical protein HPB47_016395 [Ixodes persulcatus]
MCCHDLLMRNAVLSAYAPMCDYLLLGFQLMRALLPNTSMSDNVCTSTRNPGNMRKAECDFMFYKITAASIPPAEVLSERSDCKSCKVPNNLYPMAWGCQGSAFMQPIVRLTREQWENRLAIAGPGEQTELVDRTRWATEDQSPGLMEQHTMRRK